MSFFDPPCWPLWVVCVVMLAIGVLNQRTNRMPNEVTFSLIFAGWLLGLLHSCDVYADAGTGGILAAVGCSTFAFFILLPLDLAHVIGKGSLKLQMGFAAFAGAFFGLGRGAIVTGVATGIAALLCGLLFVVWKTREAETKMMPTGLPQFGGALIALVLLMPLMAK